MGKLLDMAIQASAVIGGGGGTATIQIQNVDAGNIVWYKNGVLQNTYTDTVVHTFTINSGDTFYCTSTRAATGANIDYYLNTVYTNTYFGNPTSTTPTFTASGGNTYLFQAFAP